MYKREKKNKGRRKKKRKKENATELQRFITTVQNVTGGKQKNLKSLVRFHSGNKIDNRGG